MTIEQRAEAYIKQYDPRLIEKFPKLVQSLIPMLVGFYQAEQTRGIDCEVKGTKPNKY